VVLVVDLQDAVHPRQGEDDAAAERDRGCCQSRGHSSSNDWFLVLGRDAHDSGDVFSRFGQDGDVRQVLLKRSVIRVGDTVFQGSKDLLWAKRLLECRSHVGHLIEVPLQFG
jgi:hypothetical protein